LPLKNFLNSGSWSHIFHSFGIIGAGIGVFKQGIADEACEKPLGKVY
jgi:hypothetical protein